jgi:hypothetical protein
MAPVSKNGRVGRKFSTPHDRAPPVSTERRSPGPDEQYCSSRGRIIEQAAEIRPECGVRLSGLPGRDAGDRRLIAALLALVFGVFVSEATAERTNARERA